MFGIMKEKKKKNAKNRTFRNENENMSFRNFMSPLQYTHRRPLGGGVGRGGTIPDFFVSMRMSNVRTTTICGSHTLLYPLPIQYYCCTSPGKRIT